MVRGIANSKIGFGDLILLLRYFFKLKVSTHPKYFPLFNLARVGLLHFCNFLLLQQSSLNFSARGFR
ncbi:hypothetical protein KAN01_06615 [Acinetobacter nosocomialis]|nr:hypothetical protein KAN01_06615 [Acinetobacter nosocomialis]